MIENIILAGAKLIGKIGGLGVQKEMALSLKEALQEDKSNQDGRFIGYYRDKRRLDFARAIRQTRAPLEIKEANIKNNPSFRVEDQADQFFELWRKPNIKRFDQRTQRFWNLVEEK